MKNAARYLTAAIAICFASNAEGMDERFFEYPNAHPGKLVKIQKVYDPSTGRMETVSTHGEISTVSDLLAAEEVERAASRQRHGNLYPGLFLRLVALNPLETVKVWVKVKPSSVAPLDKTLHDLDALIENAQARSAASPSITPSQVLRRYQLYPEEAHGSDLVVVTATKLKLLAMKQDPDIASVWEHVREKRASAPSITTLAPSAYMASVPSGAGSGVKAATFEEGLTSSFLSCIGESPTYDAWIGGDDDDKRHTQAVFHALAAAAPSASLYHRKSLTFAGSNDVAYLANNGIQTVSLSSYRGGTNAYSATYSEFLTMDDMAYTYPYPVFVNPAANEGYDHPVNWQCYNAISVGNVRHTSTYELAECTQTKNPPPRYGSCISGSGASCAGDREMPHIVVPGIPNSGSTFASTCLEGTGLVYCGTSWSAPVGNGIAADVIAADSRLAGWPEKVRATLILTAQNVESGGWTTSGDERDGTGTIAGADAVSFASSHTSVSPGNSACEKGMGASSFYASDFSASKRFNFLVPNPKPSGKHLRVVLTWDSNPSVSGGTNALSDLDLVVQKNSGTTSSASWDSNVEVVDVAAADLTAGSSYYIDISPYANRIPSGSFFYYAIAWSWVTDEAP